MYYEWSTCTATCGTEGQRMRIPGCFRVLTLDQHKTMGDRTSHSLYILQIQYWQYFGFTRLTNIFIPKLFMQTLIGLWQKIVILSPILIFYTQYILLSLLNGICCKDPSEAYEVEPDLCKHQSKPG